MRGAAHAPLARSMPRAAPDAPMVPAPQPTPQPAPRTSSLREGVDLSIAPTQTPGHTRYSLASPDGKPMGYAIAGEDAVQMVHIDPKYRRQGLATALYDRIEQETGRRLRPDAMLTQDARAFWAKRDPSADLRNALNYPPDLAIPATPPGADAQPLRTAGGPRDYPVDQARMPAHPLAGAPNGIVDRVPMNFDTQSAGRVANEMNLFGDRRYMTPYEHRIADALRAGPDTANSNALSRIEPGGHLREVSAPPELGADAPPSSWAALIDALKGKPQR